MNPKYVVCYISEELGDDVFFLKPINYKGNDPSATIPVALFPSVKIGDIFEIRKV